ncbi:MAG: hypothetical protein ABI562_06310, partial [Chloroflexota bacterium]
MHKIHKLARSSAVAGASLLLVVGGSFAHDATFATNPAGTTSTVAGVSDDQGELDELASEIEGVQDNDVDEQGADTDDGDQADQFDESDHAQADAEAADDSADAAPAPEVAKPVKAKPAKPAKAKPATVAHDTN